MSTRTRFALPIVFILMTSSFPHASYALRFDVGGYSSRRARCAKVSAVGRDTALMAHHSEIVQLLHGHSYTPVSLGPPQWWPCGRSCALSLQEVRYFQRQPRARRAVAPQSRLARHWLMERSCSRAASYLKGVEMSGAVDKAKGRVKGD